MMKLPQRQDQMFSRLMSRQGQLPPRKIAPNPRTNPNPNPNRGAIFLGGNCLVAPKTP